MAQSLGTSEYSANASCSPSAAGHSGRETVERSRYSVNASCSFKPRSYNINGCAVLPSGFLGNYAPRLLLEAERMTLEGANMGLKLTGNPENIYGSREAPISRSLKALISRSLESTYKPTPREAGSGEGCESRNLEAEVKGLRECVNFQMNR